jgi:hypothetical protein
MSTKTCANPNCKRGEGGVPKVFESDKEWGLYCCDLCGGAVRRLRYYYKKREAAEGPVAYKYGPLVFLPGLQRQGWMNLFVDGPRGRVSLWMIDTAQPTRQMIEEVIHGLYDASLNPDALIQRAGEDSNRQQEARNLVTAAQEIGMPLIEAARQF